MEQLAFIVVQLRFKGEGGIAFVQVGQEFGDEGHFGLGFLVAAACLAFAGRESLSMVAISARMSSELMMSMSRRGFTEPSS